MTLYHKIAYSVLGIVFLGLFIGVSYIMDTDQPAVKNGFKVVSSAFEPGGLIPQKYTCDGDNINPPLSIRNIPEGTQSLALIMDDPDIPESIKASRGITVFDHWAVYSIPREVYEIEEGKSPGADALNGAGKTGYTGPCPPDREHRYFFKVFALDTPALNFIKQPTRAELEAAMQGHVVGTTELMGRYDRPR